MPVKRERGNEEIVRLNAETRGIDPIGIVRIGHYAVFGFGKEEIDPLFKVRIFRFYYRIVAV